MYREIFYAAIVCLFCAGSAFAQTGSITGTVTDAETGESLPGSNIFIAEIQRGASADADGVYRIENIPSGTYTLRASFIGYETFTRDVAIQGQEVTLNIELVPSQIGLDELVVVGFGTQSRRDITGSIASIGTEDLENVQLTTLENALQGNAAGVQVTQAGGTLGSPIAVRIRGTASINAGSQPLYVIDGIPITQNDGSIGNDVSGVGVATNPLINLNPNDIQSIEVLKDASASAIYGSRGSNGVVLITTKSGLPGQTRVNFGYSTGFMEATDSYDMLNGEQWTAMWNDAVDNSTFPDAFKLPTENIVSTDWMDLVQRTGSVHTINASISGGSEQTQYYISGRFSDEEGYIKGNALERYAARIKIDHQISDKVQVGLNIAPTYSRNFKRSERNQVDAPITFAALYYPNVEARDSLGNPNLGIAPNPLVAFNGTPLSNLEGTEIEEGFVQTIVASNLSWDILPNLRFNTDLSVELFRLDTFEKRSDITTDGFGTGSGFNLHSGFTNYNWNATLTFINEWEDHDLTVLAGTSLQRNENTSFNISGNNFANNELKTLNSAASITDGGGEITSYAFLGYLSRISYAFKDKYLITVNGRIDGSSRFGSDYQYGFFPAASVGWILTDENFLQDSEVLDFLKLRASYGITGNADIDNFAALALAESGANYDEVPGLTPSQLPNPNLKWEKATQLDIGLDYGLWGSRIRGSVGYFEKMTTDLLLERPISATNGFTSYFQNTGEMRNYGLEFIVTADIFNGPFAWTSSFNISMIENEVQSLIGGEDIIEGQQIVREGEALGSFYLREFAGANPEDGLAVWYLNREPTPEEVDAGTAFINESRFGDRYVTTTYNAAERIIAGDPFADFYGGFRNNFFYKNFDLGIFFQYSLGNEIYRGGGEFTDTNLSSLFNQATRQLDYWKEPGDITDVPKPILLTANGSNSSTRFMENASYVRLKTATLGYTLPGTLTGDYRLRIYASGTNLLTFTSSDFHGMDPEVTSAPDDNIAQGNIFFAPAQARTIRFGVDFQF